MKPLFTPAMSLHLGRAFSASVHIEMHLQIFAALYVNKHLHVSRLQGPNALFVFNRQEAPVHFLCLVWQELNQEEQLITITV